MPWLSRVSCSLMDKGSSSPSCSARSPVSLQESNSEPGDDDREREERRPCFSSSDWEPSSGLEWELNWPAAEDKVLRGIFAARRVVLCEGILKGVDCVQQPSAICSAGG